MIKTVADLVQKLVRQEVAILDNDPVAHGPTIGAMYEGLTRDILDRALPGPVDLRVVSGFAIGGDGTASDQLDCMVVVGEGQQIPHTPDYRYPVGQVVAIVEVKKRLDSEDLLNGYENLRSVSQLAPTHPMPVRSAVGRAFRHLTGMYLLDDRANIRRMPPHLQQLYHLLVMDAVSPARILLGYHGHKTEAGLRDAIINHVRGFVGKPGHGPRHLPGLILNQNALVAKQLGFPWMGSVRDGRFTLLASSTSTPPALALLDIIWSALHFRGYVPVSAFGDENDLEQWTLLLETRPASSTVGWEYIWCPFTQKELSSLSRAPREWEPVRITETEAALLHIIDEDESLDLAAPPEGFSDRAELDALVVGLVAKRLIGLEATGSGRFRLLTERLVVGIIPDGRMVAGDDVDGKVSTWVHRRMREKP